MKPLALISLLLACVAVSTLAVDKKEKAAKKKLAEKAALMAANEPYIASAFPGGGQRGTTVRVQLSGKNLQDITAVRITGQGVRAKIESPLKNDMATLSIAIDADAEPGERDLRVLSAGGASNRSRFHVGELAEVVEVEPNSDFAKAQVLTNLPVVVNGQALIADRDIFRFTAKAGETLVFAAQARALLPYIADAVPGWCDPVLTLYDAQGRRLQSVDDFRLKPDPVLIFKVLKDGDYFVEISDVLFRGRNDFVYRLTVGAIPWLTDVYPLGAPRGSTVNLELSGANLSASQMKWPMSANAKVPTRIGPPRGGVWHNSVPFAVSNGPESNEVEPNDSPKRAMEVLTPIVVNGRIDKPGDRDCFSFKAARNQRLVFEVTARRLDSPVDSYLTLFDNAGRELAQNDDAVDERESLATHHADSRLVYTFKQATNYCVQIRDTQGKGGREFAYRLKIAPEEPDYTLRVSPDNPRVGRGETVLLSVDAQRRDGFDREIQLLVNELPEGFIASHAIIPAGQNTAALTITAPPNAAEGIVLPRIRGSANYPDRSIVREAIPTETVMQAFFYTYHVPTRELLLSVVGAAPFSIASEISSAEALRVARDGQVQIPVTLKRQDGVAGAVSVSLAKPPPGVTAKAALISADTNAAMLIVNVTPKAPLGRNYLILQGTLRSAGRAMARIAPAIAIEVLPARQTAMRKP